MNCRCGKWTWVQGKLSDNRIFEPGFWLSGKGKAKETKQPSFVCEKCGCKLGTGSVVYTAQEENGG